MQDLLRTKLFIPLPPSEAIAHPQLVERLTSGLAGKLSLVIAPAGYGKTTLVTTWLHQLADGQVVWLSLDEADNDVRRFFTYMVAALRQLDESFQGTQEAFLQEPHGEPSTTALVTSLLNQLVAYSRPVVLVLDDYHEITDLLIHEAVAFWLEHQPPNVHLVMTSRAAPPLPLPRMRVRREVTEIDTEALRFTRAESADFLQQHMRLDLSADDVAQLDSVTEGWVASLQLAALSLQNQGDPTAFLKTFKGDNRYIVDYLVTEVLDRQPEHIRDFLLQTSILERLNVELCDAVTGQTGSQDILDALDQAHLFVIPLDDQRHWYRYHRLFADCLQAELQRTAPEDFPAYHERASHGFNRHGFIEEAIQHAFAASNPRLAANLIAANARTIHWVQGKTHRLWQWIQQLPEEEVRRSPQLLITTARLNLELFSNQDNRSDELLDDASALIHAPAAADREPYTVADVAKMETEIALTRASLQRLRGNLAQAIEYCEEAVAFTQEAESPLLSESARSALAMTRYQAGNITQSLAHTTPQLEFLTEAKSITYTRYVVLSYLVDALRLHGQLVEATRLFQRVEPYLPRQQSLGAAMLAIHWAEILRERNQLTRAADHLMLAIETLKPLRSMAAMVQSGAITLARIRQAQSKGQEGLELLRDTRRDFGASNTYSPSARVSAAEALLHLQQGNLASAKAWVEESGLNADDDPTYLLEIDYLVLARVLIADGAASAAQTLLEKLEQSAMDGGRVARLIEGHMLRALAHEAAGELELALGQLGKAIQLAQPEGFARLFVDEGKRLVPLLKQIAGRGFAIDYIRWLLPLFDEELQLQKLLPTMQPTAEPTSVESDDDYLLLNPLTNRELATLRYLASDLTIPEIAEQMILAPSTIRTYVKSIYGKLDVHNRIEAVNRARALGLLN